MLVSVHLSNGAPLPDLTGLIWQRQFTSQLILPVCPLVMSLSRWGLLLCSVLGQGHCSNSEDRDGGRRCVRCVPLAAKSCTAFVGLLFFPSEAVGWVPWLPGFSDQAYRWSGLVTLFSSTWGYSLVSFPKQDNRIRPTVTTTHCLGIQSRPKFVLSSLVKWAHQLCSTDGGRLGLCSMDSEASFVFRFSSPVGQVEGCVQWEQGYKLDSLPHHRGKSSSKALGCLNSSRSTPQVPWLKKAIGFVLQTISWSRLCLFTFYKPSIF